MIGWGIAALVGALAGALIAPRLFLDVNFMGGVLIYSFAAATLGGFDSPFGAVLGGWIIGVAENLAGTYVDFIGVGPEDPRAAGRDPRGAAVPADRPVRLRGGGAGHERASGCGMARLGGSRSCSPCCCRSSSAAYRVGQFTQALALAIAVLGLNLLVGYSGQISLGHGAFFALGAYASAILDRRPRRSRTCSRCRSPGSSAASPASCSACRRCACAASTSRCVTLGLAIATPQIIKRADGLTGGTQGLSVDKVTAPGVVGPGRRPVAVLRHARGRRGRCSCSPPSSCAAGSGARWWRSARTRSRRKHDGRRPRALQDRRVRGQRRRTPASAARCSRCRSASSRRSRSRSRCRSRSWRRSSSAAWPRSRGALFGALFIEFVPVYAADVDEALAGRDLRRRADPLHVPAAGRRDGARSARRPREHERERRRETAASERLVVSRREDRGGLTMVRQRRFVGWVVALLALALLAGGCGRGEDERRRRRRRRRLRPGHHRQGDQARRLLSVQRPGVGLPGDRRRREGALRVRQLQGRRRRAQDQLPDARRRLRAAEGGRRTRAG